MKIETIKISLSPKKIQYLLLVILALLFFAWLMMRGDKSQNILEKHKEFVLPLDFGVSDPDFDGKITNFTMLNAKASVDTRDKIDGVASLKIFFSDQSVASVKVPSYFNAVNEGGFYRLGFWAKSDSTKNKLIAINITEKEKNQDLGKFSLNKDEDVKYFEFKFQANHNAQDLIFISSDGVVASIWIDNVSVEKINVNSAEELKNIKSTIPGNTTWKNIDQNKSGDGGDSGYFLSRPGRKIGQVFNPTEDMLSGVAFKILRHGTGGNGIYQVQLREFDENLGIISDEVVASTILNQTPSSKILDEIKKKEQQIREKFEVNEQDIKDGKVPNDKTEDKYPNTFTREQIDSAKATKRIAKLEIDIRDMKEEFNNIEEFNIPLATKLDSNKKYWIGIDNIGAVVDRNNYISIATASSLNSMQDEIGGFKSEVAGNWFNSPALWFKTFYPKHYKVDDNVILSGATISDIGEGKLIYRYHFAPDEIASISGFSGRKVYDMLEGSYKNIDISGNYTLSYDDFVVYKFNTVYPARKIIIRDVDFHQSLSLEISTDGENWEKIYFDNPSVQYQSIDPIVFNPEEKTTAFYLRIKPSGDICIPYGLSVEAELQK